MYDWDLQAAPEPPHADLKRRVLDEWLRNPFLDDDIAGLSLRLDTPVPDLKAALGGLCDTGFLRSAGHGFVLALDPAGGIPDGLEAAAALAALSGAVVTDPVEPGGESEFEAPRVEERGDPVAFEIGNTAGQLPPGDPIAEEDLVEALPFGMVVLGPAGGREVANERAAEMLGVPCAQLDAATLEAVTGVNPRVALDRDGPLAFSLTRPRALEVTVQARRLATGTVILVLLRDVSLLEETSRIQAEVQEQLFARMKQDLVDPLVRIERFLEHPSAAGLVQARVAMEQVNWFLQEFFLRGPHGDGR